jgi:ABC-type lipoprotein release transport system permease subunit
MSLALFSMIQYSGLMTGYLHGMERNILDLEMGDIQIFASDYLDKPSIYNRIENPDDLIKKLEAAGYRASGRLKGGGLAAGENSSAGVVFRGVNPGQDASVSDVYKHVSRGEWLDVREPAGIVIGRRLALSLNVDVGDEVVVLSQAADGSMANDLFKVRGVLKSIGEEVDRGGIYMIDRTFRELMVVPGGVHQIIVRKPPTVPLDKAADEVASIAGGADTRSWRQLTPTLASMLDSSRGAMYFMFVIVFLAIAIVILNAMLMAVFERIREFGVLKAIGVAPWVVFKTVITETIIQTGLAIAAGGILSIPAAIYLSTSGINLSSMSGASIMGIAWDPIWKSSFSVQTFTGPVVMLAAIVLMAALYPALKAAFIRPVAAMHHR